MMGSGGSPCTRPSILITHHTLTEPWHFNSKIGS
ncbi:hypothetical protein TBK1r_51470 [Stieleria magnilauensis]|uniref:Uncharacterized protein n=1 Tax=Stieleria magnilauensis TaxID=2527963 RepID=A0ABX5XVS1_9BACT|nr:hypothetical protein TBK1r_51470 [Planctomycetes bacterium TBK1r]